MKTNTFLTCISIILACLIGYLTFNIAQGKEYDIIYGFGSTICFIATLLPTIGLQYKDSRSGTNIRVLSVLFFIVFLISHFCFAGFGIKMSYYIITNGIILVIYLALFYKLQGVKEL